VSDLLLSSPVRTPSQIQVQEVPTPTDKATVGDAARQFEGMLMAQLFQSMRKTVQSSGLFGDSGAARSTYEYLFDQAVVDHSMKSGKGWGLAPRLEEAWLARQAAQKNLAEA